MEAYLYRWGHRTLGNLMVSQQNVTCTMLIMYLKELYANVQWLYVNTFETLFLRPFSVRNVIITWVQFSMVTEICLKIIYYLFVCLLEKRLYSSV